MAGIFFRPWLDKTEAFQKLIKENNEVFFTKLFEENYKKDDTFFKKTGLANENDVNAYKKYNLILDNILADTSKSNEDIELAKRAKKFNSNYIIFFELNDKIKDFFKNKYYKEQADQYLKNLDQLDVSEFETLNNDRVSLKDKILLYEKKSCELKSILDKLKQKAKDNNSALSSIYNNLKKEYPIPYLQEVISKMSKNLDSYNSESLNCNQNEILQKWKKLSLKKNNNFITNWTMRLIKFLILPFLSVFIFAQTKIENATKSFNDKDYSKVIEILENESINDYRVLFFLNIRNLS